MEFDKTKRVNKNRTISYNVSNGYVPMQTIEEYTIKNNPEIETKELKKYKLEKELRYGINNRI